MLEYSKTILTKVSFDRTLFTKELRKAIGYINPEEVADLRRWCYSHFQQEYREELDQKFTAAEVLPSL